MDRFVIPNLGDAHGNPICPLHHRRMRARICRSFGEYGSDLTHLWWRCEKGCRTAMVPLPYHVSHNLGPKIPDDVLRSGPRTQ